MRKVPKGKSIRWMVMMLMLVMAGMGWGIASGGYATDVQGWGPASYKREGVVVVSPVIEFAVGAVRFLWNALVQIPSAHRVVWHTLTERPGTLVVIALLESAVGVFGWWAGRLERELAKADRKLSRRSARK